MTPIQFILEHRETVLSVFEGSSKKAWEKLTIQIPEINDVMAFNSFKVIVGPFIETSRFFEDRLNSQLNKSIAGLNEKLNSERELNNRLNNQVEELNVRLNNLEGLNAELNNKLVKYRLNASDDVALNKYDEGLNVIDVQVKSKLNIAGWTVAKSGKYYRAFRKIKGRVHGVHLGKSLNDAEQKIMTKQSRLSVQSKPD